MILTLKRHGRTKRDVRNLVTHLNKQVDQQSRVIRIGNISLSNADDAMAYMTTMRDASRATVAMHHISISPRVHLDDDQRDEVVRRIMSAVGAEDHAFVLWRHSDKARASDDVADDHYHLVVAHIGPDGRALDDSWSYVRMEAAARSLEVDLHEPLTPSRMTKSVVKELRRIGREDVADLLIAPPAPPASAMSSRTKARAERLGIDLPEAQAAVRAAWAASDSPGAFRAALSDNGFELIPGKRAHVFLVTRDGIEIGALDRIVREKRATVAARMEEERNERRNTEAAKRRRSNLFRDLGSAPVLRESPAPAAVAGREPIGGWTEATRRDDRAPHRNRNDSGETRRNPRSSRRRVAETAAITAIARTDAFRKLRFIAESLASGKFDQKARRRRAFEFAARVSLSGMRIDYLKSAAAKLAAGEMLSHSELSSLEDARMKSMKPSRKAEFKTKLLAEVGPSGFDANAFTNDIHMIKAPSPGNPVTCVMLRDGGWCEIDLPRKRVHTWGTTGRAQVLAQAVADAMGIEVDHLARTASVGADAAALKVSNASEDAIKAMVVWWTLRGYSAMAAPDGCWINAGRARIRDVGDHLEIHGGLTDKAVEATILKAKEEWGGAVYLDGHWTQAEQDHIWLAAMRAGVEVANCKPSPLIRQIWDRERAASSKAIRTMSAVQIEVLEAQRLLDAARGDIEQAKKLPGSLQAFIAIFLDDDQRRELAAQPIAEVVPHLNRFREIGAIELDSHKATSESKVTFAEPQEKETKRDPGNMHAP